MKSGVTVTTTCGKQVTTVGQDYFDQYGDWLEFMSELNEWNCGKKGIGTIIEDGGEYIIT